MKLRTNSPDLCGNLKTFLTMSVLSAAYVGSSVIPITWCSDPRAIKPFLFEYTAVHIERPLCVTSFVVCLTRPLGISSPSLMPNKVGLNKCSAQLHSETRSFT